MCYKQVLMGFSIVVYTVLITYQRSMTSARKMETFDFEAWSSKILDINSVNFNDENKNEHSELLNTNYGIQLFTYATDCNQKGSRWDYLTSSAKPIKKLNTTNGFVTFIIPRKGTTTYRQPRLYLVELGDLVTPYMKFFSSRMS